MQVLYNMISALQCLQQHLIIKLKLDSQLTSLITKIHFTIRVLIAGLTVSPIFKYLLSFWNSPQWKHQRSDRRSDFKIKENKIQWSWWIHSKREIRLHFYCQKYLFWTNTYYATLTILKVWTKVFLKRKCFFHYFLVKPNIV